MLLESVPGSSCAPGAHAGGQPSGLSTPGTRHSSYAPNRADLVRVAIAGLIGMVCPCTIPSKPRLRARLRQKAPSSSARPHAVPYKLNGHATET
jgi:hypothetical protein